MPILAAFLILLAAPPVAPREGRGQGAIVISDFTPVYQSSSGTATVATLMRGNAVSGIDRHGVLGFALGKHLFAEADGRLHVVYVAGSPNGTRRLGWIDPRDLSQFAYAGSCAVDAGPFAGSYVGTPLSEAMHGPPQHWNPCFEEARDAKLAAMRALRDAPVAQVPSP